jgi:chemotaxis signal transduction protein
MGSARYLRFGLGGRAWAIALDGVSSVARCERLWPVPGAPAVVLGLAECQGSVVAVLDCARLLGARPAAEDACLVLLAPPFATTALFVSSRIELTSGEAAGTADPGSLATPAGPARLIDPLALVRSVEGELRGR